MSSEIALKADSISKIYYRFERPLDRLKAMVFDDPTRWGTAFHALNEISFELKRGSVLGVIGHNGAGKSTLLQIICGTLTPSSGSLTRVGRVAALLELGAGFNPDFSGRENIFLNAAVLGLNQAEIDDCYDDIVEFSGLADFINEPVKTYSTGMYMRLAFAIATSVQPEILIIDEALSVGDGAFARKSFDRIMALKAKGATILFCSHAMYHIEAICDQALWLEKGSVRLIGPPDKVTKAYTQELLGKQATGVGGQTPTASFGTARFLDIRTYADGQEGRLLELIPGRSLVRIEVSFAYDPELQLPTLAFGLETPSGMAVSSGSTVFDGVSAEVTSEGRAKAVLIFPDIALMRGTYLLTLFLGCENTILVYDQALHCAEFVVQSDRIEQGICYLTRQWNDGPRIEVHP